MITTADLKNHTKADLAKMAKRLGVAGWAAMKKEQLVIAIAKASKRGDSQTGNQPKAKKPVNGHSGAGKIKARATAGRTRGKVSVKQPSSAVQAASENKRSATTPQRVSRIAAATASPKKSSTRSKKNVADAETNAGRQLTKANPKSKTESRPEKPSKSSTRGGGKSKKVPTSSTDPKVLKRIRELQLQRQSDKDIAFRPMLVRPPGVVEPVWEKEPEKDRIALFVRDAYWMHASWDITRGAIERAKAAMLEQWHGAKPILRLLRMDDTGTTTTSETVERDLPIHGGCRNCYIEWTGEPASFRVLIGYLSPNGRFHAISKSNIVKTPSAGSSDIVDEHWTDLAAESERIYAMSGGYESEKETGELKEMLEQRLNRTLGAPALAKLGAGADSPFRRRGGFHFDMDVELVVYGSTVPDGYLTINGEPVTLRTDGTFVLRVPFPDRRQVLPAVACSRDGSQQRTIVVAVERNTKIMEPLETEQDTGE